MEIKDITPGKQYMIRRHADSRRVRVEATRAAMQFDGIRTVTVFGRYIRPYRRSGHVVPGSTIVGNERAWSTYPELIEEVEQI